MSERITNFRELVEQSRQKRRQVRDLVQAGKPLEAEQDQNRAAEYTARDIALNLGGAEALIGPTNDLQAIWFIVRGVQIRRAVARVDVLLPGSSDRGTGFLVSPRLFLTNQHVIPNDAAAAAARITFDDERDERGLPRPQTIYDLAPERFAAFSQENELDFALIALGKRLQGGAAPDELGYCILSDRPNKHAIGMNVNIIQHPSGLPKMIALRNNILTYRTARSLLYETDTEHGSSGAPVFNDFWEVVALHHFGQPFLELKDETGQDIPNNVNEGVRISAIYTELSARLHGLSPERQALLSEALSYDKQDAPPSGLHVLTPASTSAQAEHLSIPGATTMTSPDARQELRVTVPIEITVRVGGIPAEQAALVAANPTRRGPAAVLKSAAEVLHVDTDYSNRRGYDPEFIPGTRIELPELGASIASQLAPLHSGQPDASAGELKYEHFSLKLNRSKRIAIFTATNIDGQAYLNVDRASGQVTGEEGDKWFLDPRVDGNFYLDQSFYGDWSDYFDRGHLTRRTDPTWGTEQEAERANADTFHFTNCSPQHFRFNESAKYWQGAERYVLENGVLANDSKTHISVFQGPIFNRQIDLMADTVQIPSSFFKVIVWKGQDRVKSVGLVVDQLPLLSETRKSLGKPKDLPSVDVTHWRVSIKSIEERTGLSFGQTVNDADTIRSAPQPQVGEAIVRVRSFADLLPG